VKSYSFRLSFSRVKFGLFFLMFLFSNQSFAEFEVTSPGTQEDSEFGGIQEDVLTDLEEKALNNDYSRKMKDRIDTFKEGRKSSGFGGAGRYSNIGEGHFNRGVTPHANPSNGLEKKVDDALKKIAESKGIPTGNDEAARQKRNRELARNDKDTTNQTGCEDGQMIFNGSNKRTTDCFNLSAAIVDIGPAHGTDKRDDRGRLQTESHRLYAMRKEVKEASIEAGEDYAKQALKDATLTDLNEKILARVREAGGDLVLEETAEGMNLVVIDPKGGSSDTKLNPDLSFISSEVSWIYDLQHDYYRRHAVALAAARLSEADTSKYGTRHVEDEFVNLAAKKRGGNKEKIIERIAERTVLGDLGGVCLQNLADAKGCKEIDHKNLKNLTVENFYTKVANLIRDNSIELKHDFVESIVSRDDLENIKEIVNNEVKAKRGGKSRADLLSDRLKKKAGSFFMGRGGFGKNTGVYFLKEVASFITARQAKNLFSQQKNKLKDEDKKKLEARITKLKDNKCLEADVVCLSKDDQIKNYIKSTMGEKAFEDLKNKENGEALKERVEELKFTPIQSGDPLNFVPDTREINYRRMATALDRPLSEMVAAVRSLDFNEDTDKVYDNKGYGKPFAEFKKAVEDAIESVKKTKEAARKSAAEISKMTDGSQVTNRFDEDDYRPEEMTFRELFGNFNSPSYMQTLDVDFQEFERAPANEEQEIVETLNYSDSPGKNNRVGDGGIEFDVDAP